MARKCHVVGCSRSVARKGFMWAMMKEIGLTDIGHSMYAVSFGEGACAYHCAEAVKRAAFLEGLEVRETKEKIEVVGKRQPDKHYPADYHSRARRLAELEAEVRRPDRISIALDQLEHKVQALKRRQAEQEQSSMQAIQKVKLLRYLKYYQGLDPTNLYDL